MSSTTYSMPSLPLSKSTDGAGMMDYMFCCFGRALA